MATTGTFLVTAADPDSAVVRDVARGQVFTLATNPDLAVGDVVEATLSPHPPLEVTWSIEEISARRSPTVERLSEPPGPAAREAAAGLDPGEMTTLDETRHVIAVPADRTDDAAADVADDEATLTRAARLGVDRVEVRAGDGVVSVRYR